MGIHKCKKTIPGRGNANVGGAEADAAHKNCPANGARHAGPGRRDKLYRPGDPCGRQSAHPPRSGPLHRGHGLPAIRLSMGLRVCAIAYRRHGRQARAAPASVLWPQCSGRSPRCWADLSRALASSSAPGSYWASARRRNFRPARAWCGIGSTPATGASPPASSIAPRPWAPRSPCLLDFPDAELRLAHDVRDHGRRRSCNGGDLVYRLSQSDRCRAHGGGELLPHRGRSARVSEPR